MADVKWIKITVGVFDDEKMMLIDSMPDNDALIVIWFKLLDLAGKINNNGMLLLNDKMAYTDEMLSTVFRRPLNTVKMALKIFEDFEMIEIEDVISIANWEKHQNIEGMDKIKEQNRLRQQRFREKQKKISNVISRDSNAIDKEEDKEIEKELKDNVELKTPTSLPYKEIIEFLNETAGTKFRHTTKKTQSHIKARFNEGFTLEDFKSVIVKKYKDQWFVSQGFMRPETLFGNKFDGYLNEPLKVTKAANTNTQVETPDWFDKAIEKQAPSDEEEKRIRDMLNKYSED